MPENLSKLKRADLEALVVERDAEIRALVDANDLLEKSDARLSATVDLLREQQEDLMGDLETLQGIIFLRANRTFIERLKAVFTG